MAAMEAGAASAKSDRKARKHLRQQQTRQLISLSQRKRAAMEDADSDAKDVPSDSGSEQRLLEEADTVLLEDVRLPVHTPKIQKQHHQQEQGLGFRKKRSKKCSNSLAASLNWTLQSSRNHAPQRRRNDLIRLTKKFIQRMDLRKRKSWTIYKKSKKMMKKTYRNERKLALLNA